MAMRRNEYATMDEIRELVSSSLNVGVATSSLSGPLRKLKSEKYGAILRDVERTSSGERIRNLTAFSDPMMKSFVRFMNNLDTTSLMPELPGSSVGQSADD
jgi:hypothetical protein